MARNSVEKSSALNLDRWGEKTHPIISLPLVLAENVDVKKTARTGFRCKMEFPLFSPLTFLTLRLSSGLQRDYQVYVLDWVGSFSLAQ